MPRNCSFSFNFYRDAAGGAHLVGRGDKRNTRIDINAKGMFAKVDGYAADFPPENDQSTTEQKEGGSIELEGGDISLEIRKQLRIEFLSEYITTQAALFREKFTTWKIGTLVDISWNTMYCDLYLDAVAKAYGEPVKMQVANLGAPRIPDPVGKYGRKCKGLLTQHPRLAYPKSPYEINTAPISRRYGKKHAAW